VDLNEDSEKVTIRLPKRYLRALDFLVQLDDFPSRSEAIRESIRDMVYSRTELVMDRLEKMKKAEESLASMETFQKEYMKQ
jgi:Arc/MetJ-type ribon-helix-helix transcriptional regulator